MSDTDDMPRELFDPFAQLAEIRKAAEECARDFPDDPEVIAVSREMTAFANRGDEILREPGGWKQKAKLLKLFLDAGPLMRRLGAIHDRMMKASEPQ